MTLDPEFLLPADAMDAPLTEDDLVAYFTEDADDFDGEVHFRISRFKIDDDSAAEWAMRKLAAATARAEEVERAAAAHHAEIDAWVERRMKPTAREVQFFDALLVDYGIRQVEEADRKTIDVPSGVVRSNDRRKTPNITITDPKAVAGWAYDTLGHDERMEVVPPQDPKVLVSKLGDHVEVVLTRDADDRIVGARVIDENGVEVPGVIVEFGDLTTKAVPR